MNFLFDEPEPNHNGLNPLRLKRRGNSIQSMLNHETTSHRRSHIWHRQLNKGLMSRKTHAGGVRLEVLTLWATMATMIATM